jgi:hypothetical protein
MAAHFLLTGSDCCYHGNLDLSEQAVSMPFLDRGMFSNFSSGFRMGCMEA